MRISKQFHRYRRNLLTFKQNSSLLNYWTLFTLLMSCIIALPMAGVAKALFTPVTMFWLQYLLYFAFFDIFHGIILPLTIISVPVEPEKTSSEEKSFYVRTTLVLEPRRPEASELVLLKSGPTHVNRRSKYQTERKFLFTMTPLLQKSKELVPDQPIFLPLKAQSGPDLWNLSYQVETAHIEKAAPTKASGQREQQSLKTTKPQSQLSLHEPHSCLSSHCPLLDPKDFQHMVDSILRCEIIHSTTFLNSYEFRKCSQDEHSSLAGPEVICIYLAFDIFSSKV